LQHIVSFMRLFCKTDLWFYVWRHVALVNTSHRIYEWVMVYIWMRYVIHIKGTWAQHALSNTLFVAYSSNGCTYEYVKSHVWMCYDTHMNGSCHTYEWVMAKKRVMSHSWMCPVTHCVCVCVCVCVCDVDRMRLRLSVFMCLCATLSVFLCMEFVLSHIRMSHATHTDETTSHVAHMNKSCHSY